MRSSIRSTLFLADESKLPFWLWLTAPVLGVLIALAGLSYSPDGRINVLWIWLLWAGLPFIGSLFSIFWLLFGGRRPWVVRWLPNATYWQPTALQRWRLAMLLQWAWAVVALAMLSTFLLLLLFSDLAFGWSSTLALTTSHLRAIVEWIAYPWAGFWPAAVPNMEILEATRFVRIAPQAGSVELAGAWWPFLLANVLTYNLLPRLLLGSYCFVRWQRLVKQSLAVQSTHNVVPLRQAETSFVEAPLSCWEEAQMIDWEQRLNTELSAVVMGDATWQADVERWQKIERAQPRQLVWHVLAGRSPVAELGDWVAKAAHDWQPEQAIYVHCDSAIHGERHLASWRAFARHHGLTWLTKV